MLDDVLGDISPALAISVLVVGFGLLVSMAAYLLPGVRVVRSIAGVVCILAAVVILLVSFEAGPADQTLILGTMILLSALIISVRPEWKPKAQKPPYPSALPQSQPYPPQPQPQQSQQPLSPQPQPQQSQQAQSPQVQSQQPHLQQNIQTPPAMHQPQAPSQQDQAAAQQQQPGPGYPGSGG